MTIRFPADLICHFETVAILPFSPVWLENDIIHITFWRFFKGNLTPLIGNNVNKSPEGHIFAQKRVIRCKGRKNLSTIYKDMAFFTETEAGARRHVGFHRLLECVSGISLV